MTTETKYPAFADVTAIFERLYAELREATNENTPNSWTWFKPTAAELEEDAQITTEEWFYGEHYVGSHHAPVVAWVYECNGPTLARVHAGATEAEIEDLFRSFMNLNQEA